MACPEAPMAVMRAKARMCLLAGLESAYVFVGCQSEPTRKWAKKDRIEILVCEETTNAAATWRIDESMHLHEFDCLLKSREQGPLKSVNNSLPHLRLLCLILCRR